MWESILYVLFWILSILIVGIVLIQEGRGGGLGQSLGGSGGELFGHGAGGVNKATFLLAGLLIATAIGLAKLTISG
jgi:preprotein translocase subunit SecG